MSILNSVEDMGPGELTSTVDRKSSGRGIWDDK